jgi:hypothetical protein
MNHLTIEQRYTISCFILKQVDRLVNLIFQKYYSQKKNAGYLTGNPKISITKQKKVVFSCCLHTSKARYAILFFSMPAIIIVPDYFRFW